MSIYWMNKVWGMDDINQSEMLLLLALCDRANDDGICWPGQLSLAKKCGVTDRTIRRTLKSLESKNLLEITSRQGEGEGRKTNIYKVTLGEQPDKLSGGQPDTPVLGATGHLRQATGHLEGGNRTPLSSNTSVNTSEDTSVNNINVPKKIVKPDSFKEFFDIYPENRKGGSDRSAWDKAKKLKLTDDDFKLMINDVLQRKERHTQWLNGYVQGVTKYMDECVWKTPIITEQQNGQSQRASQPVGEVARIQSTIDARAKARYEALHGEREGIHEGGASLE